MKTRACEVTNTNKQRVVNHQKVVSLRKFVLTETKEYFVEETQLSKGKEKYAA